MSTFTAILVGHADVGQIRRSYTQLTQQTRPPDEIIVLYCCCEEPVPGALLQPCKEDYGHSKRAVGINVASCDYIGFFNHDDYYAPTYIETMLAQVGGSTQGDRMAGVAEGIALNAQACDGDGSVDVVYCWWCEGDQPRVNVEFEGANSTAGNFIIRQSLARRIGWRDSKDYANDADFINRVRDSGAVLRAVKDILYWHNRTEPTF